MRLFVAGIACVLLALSFPGIKCRLQCNEFFFKGIPPVIPGILEKSELQTNGFSVICQEYKDKIRYATLYSTTGRIPFFSAYKYTRTKEFTRPNPPNIWMTELKLEPLSSEMRVPFDKQARNEDYWIKNTYNHTPGTLFPTSHSADKETAKSTYTLTNSVPLNNRFKKGIWNLVETTLKQNMDNNCHDNNDRTVAHVLTGVIPGGNQLNKRVNVPSDVWTAFCCYNRATKSWVSKTYHTKNIPYDNVTNITLKSLEDLQTFLQTSMEKKVELFNNKCR